MAQPLKVNAQNNLQTMSAANTDYIVYRLGTAFASSDTGVGTVQVNPADATGLTLIGTFTDTKRPDAVGSHPVGTSVTSTTYNFYQDRTGHPEPPSPPIPLEYDTSSKKIQQQSDATINAGWIDRTQDTIVAMGSNAVGCYVLQPSAPVGGTWTAKGTITNSLVDGTTNNSYLWRKTAAASAPTTVRPVKYSSGNIQEMTDAEINDWTGRLRNKLKDGIGQYELSTSAPTSGGTWAAAGSAFSDTRKQVANQNYTGYYTGSFTGYYTGTFTGNFTGNYTQFYSGYAGTTYTGYSSQNFTQNFAGTYSDNFAGTYTGLTVQSSNETVSNMTLWVRTA